MLNIFVKADALQLPSSLSGGNDPKLITSLFVYFEEMHRNKACS